MISLGRLVFSERIRTGIQNYEEWQADEGCTYAAVHLGMTRPNVQDSDINQYQFGRALWDAGCIQLADVQELLGEEYMPEVLEYLRIKYIEGEGSAEFSEQKKAK